MGSSRRWRGVLPGAILIFLVFVFPLPEGVIPGPWDALIYAALVFALVRTVLWLWNRARWARQLRRSLAAQHPHALVSIVEIWPEGESEECLGVLRADVSGLTFFDASASFVTIGWPEVASINSVQHDYSDFRSKTFGPMSRELIHVTTTDGLLVPPFRPRGPAGFDALGPFRLADFVLAVRRKRVGAVEPG
jgi:hypothetical protein